VIAGAAIKLAPPAMVAMAYRRLISRSRFFTGIFSAPDPVVVFIALAAAMLAA
jgi:hypothetical protein